MGPEDSTSAITSTPLGTYVVIAYRSAGLTSSMINVYRWSGTAWIAQATGLGRDLAHPLPIDRCSTITTVRLTNAPVTDFAVTFCTNDEPSAAVVTDAGGSWHLLPVRDNLDGLGTNDPILFGPTFGAGEVTVHINNCQPTCVGGSFEVATYRYDPSSGMLTATGPTTLSRTY